MAGSAATSDQPFRARSVSLPSRTHPIAVRVEEELRKLKTAATSMWSSTEKVCGGLRGVGDLYNSVGDLLRLPSLERAVFSSAQKKRLEEELEISVVLLDLVDNMKGVLVAMKDHVQDLSLTLRRRGNKITQGKERRRSLSGKELQKSVNRCCKASKQMDERCGSFETLDRDSDLSMVMRVLIESRDITLSVLRSVLHLLSTPWQRQKGRRWSIISKAMQKRKVACENTHELSFDSSLRCILNKDVDDGRILHAQEQLMAAEDTIEALETELQSLLRRLIQCRVAFLNILSLN
ncbi:hypothetical protein MUK42_21601 [Musa troglodytarum]|uniref:Uncharacterized protein n=1 Tax=Musa troglodytarum TaxID=320322 RepID=A0A9E7K5R1_9LILI|nr:hypothetical protein MUK42_21601 [Musa troglodytarum]